MYRIYGLPTPLYVFGLCTCLSLTLISPNLTAEETPEYRSFQDWTLKCNKPSEDTPETCFINQNLILRKTGQRLLSMVVTAPINSKQASTIISLPLGISLPPGISIQIDNGEIHRLAIERCDQNGCLTALALSPELIQALKAGLQAKITFSDSNRRSITVPVSLKGFTAGYNALIKTH